MGVTNSLPETTQEMPQNEDIEKIWKQQIRKEEKAGHESEYDLSEEDEAEENADKFKKIRETQLIANMSGEITENSEEKQNNSTNALIDQNFSNQLETKSLENNPIVSNNNSAIVFNNDKFFNSDSSDSSYSSEDEVFYPNTGWGIIPVAL